METKWTKWYAMTSHVIAYRSTELLFGTHTFNFNCFLMIFIAYLRKYAAYLGCCLMAHLGHLGWIELSTWSLHVILCITHPVCLELPLSRTSFVVPGLFEPLTFYCIWFQPFPVGLLLEYILSRYGEDIIV